mgnify:CR=1 FL=1
MKPIAVLGAGTMGHGIAQVAAMSGYEVRLMDVSDDFVSKGLNRIRESLMVPLHEHLSFVPLFSCDPISRLSLLSAGLFNLILAEHTHGGQVAFPLLGVIFVPLPPEHRRYVSGRFDVSGTTLYASRGIGTVIIPAMFNCPPDLLIILLIILGSAEPSLGPDLPRLGRATEVPSLGSGI